jgi:hypothetical protein
MPREKRASAAKLIRHAMVHVICREPVDELDVDAHPLDDALADVVPGQRVAPVRDLISDGSDEPGAMCTIQRKHGEKVRSVERDVDIAVHHRATRIDIGDVEQMLVCPAWETNRQRLANAGMSAVAAGDKCGFAGFDTSVCSVQVCDDAIAALREIDELCLALDQDACVGQTIDQQPLVLVLWKDERIRVRADARAHIPEYRACDPTTRHPEVRGCDFTTARNHGVRQANLTVELERARLHGNRA